MKNDLREELRKRHLTNLITEAVVIALYEQEQAQQFAPPPPAAGAPPSPEETNQLTQDNPQNTIPSVPPVPGATAEQITLDMLIERINIIRGGKSFTDPEVYGQMTSYFKTMPIQERDVVHRFLLQVAKIVTSNTQEQTGQPDVPPAPESQNSVPTPPPAPAPVAPPTAAPPVAAPPIQAV